MQNVSGDISMPDPLLVTKVSLTGLWHNLFPGQKVLRQLIEKVRDRCLLTRISDRAGYGKTNAPLQ